jgi:nucleoside-diphosphate-sugar epimerase
VKILITGGAGFIGTHLTNSLLEKHSNLDLEIVDDLSSSSSLSKKRKKFFERNKIKFFHQTVEEWQPSGWYDQIYHLACRVGPAHVLKYAGLMAKEIADDADKMAKLAIRDGAPLISISTSEVYGKDPHGIPQREDIPLQVPATFSVRLEYALAKLLNEISLINLATVEPRLRVNLIRPFNIVGPYQIGEGGFVLPRFVEAALMGKPLTVFGDGSQIRAFTHVSDLVDALIRIMESGVNKKIYNVGSPENTCSIKHLADQVISLTGSRSEIRFVESKEIFGPLYTEAPSKIPDISLIENEIGWSSKWSLDDIIKDYALFMKNTTRKN